MLAAQLGLTNASELFLNVRSRPGNELTKRPSFMYASDGNGTSRNPGRGSVPTRKRACTAFSEAGAGEGSLEQADAMTAIGTKKKERSGTSL